MQFWEFASTTLWLACVSLVVAYWLPVCLSACLPALPIEPPTLYSLCLLAWLAGWLAGDCGGWEHIEGKGERGRYARCEPKSARQHNIIQRHKVGHIFLARVMPQTADWLCSSRTTTTIPLKEAGVCVLYHTQKKFELAANVVNEAREKEKMYKKRQKIRGKRSRDWVNKPFY